MIFIRHFVKYTRATKDKPILLVMDNYDSHISVEVINFSKEMGLFFWPFHLIVATSYNHWTGSYRDILNISLISPQRPSWIPILGRIQPFTNSASWLAKPTPLRSRHEISRSKEMCHFSLKNGLRLRKVRKLLLRIQRGKGRVTVKLGLKLQPRATSLSWLWILTQFFPTQSDLCKMMIRYVKCMMLTNHFSCQNCMSLSSETIQNMKWCSWFHDKDITELLHIPVPQCRWQVILGWRIWLQSSPIHLKKVRDIWFSQLTWEHMAMLSVKGRDFSGPKLPPRSN